MKRTILFIIAFLAITLPVQAQRQYISEWYIKDFETEFVLQDDSSVLVIEKIIADCGDLPNKHGIFRIIPKNSNTPEGKIKYPIKLISITDFNDDPYNYAVKEGWDTLTWKIGDKNITVSGENEYKIVYLVKNVIRNQENFDEFYWNISGHYWDMEIDDYRAKLTFPEGIDQDNSNISLYSGSIGAKTKAEATFEWENDNTLLVRSNGQLKKGEGVTISVSFPKGIVDPYKPSIWDHWQNDHLWFLFPLCAFIISFLLWKTHGNDPDIKKTIIPEYEAPKGFDPMKSDMILKEGSMGNHAITASIIKMAVDGLLKIREKKRTILSFIGPDHELIKTENRDVSFLSPAEKKVYDTLFAGRDEVSLSKLKKNFISR